MPCRDGGGPSPSEWDDCREQLRKQQVKLDTVTRLLCEVLTQIEAIEVPGDPPQLSDECLKWWEDHKAFDRIRRQQELSALEREEEDNKKKIKQLQNNLRSLAQKKKNLK